MDDAVEVVLDEPTMDHTDILHPSTSASIVALSTTSQPSLAVNSPMQLQESPSWQIESQLEKISLIDYHNWRSPFANSQLQRNSLVQEELGEAWLIPEDGPLPLNFSRKYLEALSDDALARLLPVLAAFRDRKKPDSFVDFKTVDYTPLHWVEKTGDR